MSPRQRLWLRRGVRLAVTAGLVVVLVRIVDIEGTGRVLASIRVPTFALSVLTVLALHVVNVWRWRLCLLEDGGRFSFSFLWVSYWSGRFVGSFLPTEYGGDALRIKDVWERLRSKTAAVLGVAWSRLTGFLAAFVIVGIYAIFAFDRMRELGLAWLAITAGAMAVAGIVAVLVLRRMEARSTTTAPTGWSGRLRSLALRTLGQLRTLFLHPRYAWRIAVLALVSQLVMITNNLLFARSVGQPVTWADMALVVPVLTIASLLPLSIGGLGVREGVYVLLLPATGITEEGALAVAIVGRVVASSMVLLGGVFFLLRERVLGAPGDGRGGEPHAG